MDKQTTKNPFEDEARILSKSSSTPKRLIVCCDGTWMTSDHAAKGDSSYQTNITRMCHALADDGVLADGSLIPQVVYYQAGVGTNVYTSIAKNVEGALGWGVNENILAAYNFLVNNYTKGDEIYLFGFSRGSFTCRSLAGMISEYGILKQEMAGKWFNGIWERYQERYQGNEKNRHWEERDWHQVAWDVNIKVMGCWDTVGSLGIPDNWLVRHLGWNKKYAFHNTELSDKIEYAFHALALDERRGPFSPTLWYIPPSNKDVNRHKHLKQCWFPGVHTDVGRGYKDHVPGDIADITFAWMVDQCIGHLSFREETLNWMKEHGDFKEPVTRKAKDERRMNKEKATHWGMAELHDSLGKVGKLIQLIRPKPRTPGQYPFQSKSFKRDQRHGGWVRNTSAADSSSEQETSMVTASRVVGNAIPPNTLSYKLFFAWLKGTFTRQSRDTPVQVYTSEYIHPCVRVRMLHDTDYDPPALRGYTLEPHTDRDKWMWVKEWTTSDGTVHRAEIPEYHISHASFAGMMVERERLGYGGRPHVPIPPRTKKPVWKFW